MADMQSALVTRLLAAVTAAGGRVFWVKVPQDASLPYIRMQTISDPRPDTLEGGENARVTRVQIDCFAASYGGSRGLAEAVIAALATPATIDGVRFGRAKPEGPRDLGEDAGKDFIHRASLDFQIEHAG